MYYDNKGHKYRVQPFERRTYRVYCQRSNHANPEMGWTPAYRSKVCNSEEEARQELERMAKERGWIWKNSPKFDRTKEK